MILRHMREPMDGQPVENTFEAVDERSGAQLGACTIYVHKNAELFPSRPIRIYMDISGDPVPDALLGAAVARAKELGQLSGEPCRIFTQVDPGDHERLATLVLFGFKDSDGLVCMERGLPCTGEDMLPPGSVVVRDDLDDPLEQQYFLERYNQLYNETFDEEWLAQFRAAEGFQRLLIVSPAGMQSEAVIWQEDGAGVIGWLYTARKWRGKGLARCLTALACDEFESRGLNFARAEVQAKIPNVLHLMEHCGFRQKELLLRYPGIDMN